MLHNMNAFPPLLSFMAILLFVAIKTSTHGNAEITEGSHGKRVIGAIIDSSSRIGKEQKVALQMAVEDFYEVSNQSLLLQIEDSHGEPIRAGLAGKSMYFLVFFYGLIFLVLIYLYFK